jgi:hypothetical protein
MTTSSGRKIIGLRVILLQWAVLTALAFLVTTLFGPKPLWTVVADGRSVVWQIGAGIAIGLPFSMLAWIVVLKINLFANFRTHLLELASRVDDE